MEKFQLGLCQVFKIAIILATYNGEKYIKEQIESIFTQTTTNVMVYVSDDGSTDNTIKIISNYIQCNDCERLTFTRALGKGYVQNFLHMLDKVSADYIFFSDQDDVWLPFKIERYLKIMPAPDVPALIGARTKTIDDRGNEIGFSPLFSRQPSFSNALVQSIAGGNTMAMTRAARDIVLKATESPTRLISHDWWFYQVLSGAGATIIYDQEPSILYRQHANNVIGENTSFRARLHRLKMLMVGRFSEWSDLNIENLLYCRASLTNENRSKLDHFIEARKSGLIRRIWLMRKSGVYRQTKLGNIALWIAIILNKI
jgi:glycosyltransferase involved in cell wall biosynthesis